MYVCKYIRMYKYLANVVIEYYHYVAISLTFHS